MTTLAAQVREVVAQHEYAAHELADGITLFDWRAFFLEAHADRATLLRVVAAYEQALRGLSEACDAFQDAMVLEISDAHGPVYADLKDIGHIWFGKVEQAQHAADALLEPEARRE